MRSILLLLGVVTTGCAGGGGASPGPPPPPHVIDGLNRVWVLNTWDSERWVDGYRDAVLELGRERRRGRRLTDRELRRMADDPPSGGLAALLAVAPTIRLDVSPEGLTLFREGLDPVEVALDGVRVPLAGGPEGTTVRGLWHEETLRLEWAFDSGGSVVEHWRLAETKHRLTVERSVEGQVDLPVHFTFVQVYDRER